MIQRNVRGRIMSILLVICMVTCYGSTADAGQMASTADYADAGHVTTTADFVHGSAETPAGTTIVYSIFVSDGTYSWNPKQKADQQTIHRINQYLKIACQYIESVSQTYGKHTRFLSDFQKHMDLTSFTTVKVNMEGEDGIDEAMWSYIDKNIDVNQLLAKYHANNIIFLVAMNTDKKSKAVTCTRDWYEGMEYPYEMVYLYNVDYQEVNPPSVYAHEMWHAFGAPDLYCTDADYGIGQKDITYFQDNIPNDIMLNCTDQGTGQYRYDRVSNVTTELTAYYVGLIDHSRMAKQLGLGESQHLKKIS